MEAIHDSTRIDVVRHVKLIDGPVSADPYSDRRTFRVTRVTITYTPTGGEWRTRHVNVSGPVLRKDGTESKNSYNGMPDRSWKAAPEWEWLRMLADGMQPTGMPELPFVPYGFDPS